MPSRQATNAALYPESHPRLRCAASMRAHFESDIDFDDNLLYHDEQEAYLVCGMNQGKHICHEIPLHSYFESDTLREDEAT